MINEYELKRHTRIISRIEYGKKVYVIQQQGDSLIDIIFRKPEKRWRDLTYVSYVTPDFDRLHNIKTFDTLEAAENYQYAEHLKSMNGNAKHVSTDTVIKVIN